MSPAPTTKAKKGSPALGIVDRLSGDAKVADIQWATILPNDMVAGSVPHIAGYEDGAVWNAAVQACGTERVHYIYTIDEDRCWYLAVPSAALASYPNAWCPLAACLPGNPEYWDRQTVYIYEQEGQVGALRWEPETGRLQLFMGPSRTTLPRIQSLDANFVTVNPAMLTPIPFRNRSLQSDKMARAFGRMLVFAGLGVGLITFAALIIIIMTEAFVSPKLDEVRARSAAASNALLEQATTALQNNTVAHFERVQQLLDTLIQIQGTLVRYQVGDTGTVEWEALLPKSYAVSDIPELAGASVVKDAEPEKDGRVRIRGTK